VESLRSELRSLCEAYNSPTQQPFIPEAGAPPTLPPHRECGLEIITPVPPAASIVDTLGMLALLKENSCEPSRMPNSVIGADPWSTTYLVDRARSWMDLTYNNTTDRVTFDGSFAIAGVGCYDGIGVTRCPQVIKDIRLSGMDPAMLGGDYDLTNIELINMGSVYGKVDNVPGNQAHGTSELNDVRLAIDWGLAPGGAQNGSLYVGASQINHNLDRWGAVATWAGGITLDVNYRQKSYSVTGPIQLPDGGSGVIHLEGATDNYPPVALAGPNQTVTANPRTGIAAVTLNGHFIDPDHDNVFLRLGWYKVVGTTWTELAWNNLHPTISLRRGTYTIVLYVWDQNSATGIDALQVTVN